MREEAAWGICNALCKGTDEQVQQLVNLGCIKTLCELLTSTNGRLRCCVLQTIARVLSAGQQKSEQESGGGKDEDTDEQGSGRRGRFRGMQAGLSSAGAHTIMLGMSGQPVATNVYAEAVKACGGLEILKAVAARQKENSEDPG